MAAATTIDTLPNDMIVEIAMQLVSNSPLPLTVLRSFKNSCKMFSEAAKDRLIKQRIVLQREFPELNWKATDPRITIFKACANAGNLEACFIVALINIFGDRDISRGVELLHKTASNGHKEALYLMNKIKRRLQNLPQLANMLPANAFSDIKNIKLDDDEIQRCQARVAYVCQQVTWNDWRDSKKFCENLGCRIGAWYNYNRSFCSEACRWNQRFIELCERM
ncbi:hypothetical protein LUZ63_015968 [Rhynchospora breviuscula]|uniref:At2g35280-like TPR domain-containing protein n=1 Tax=Rhynchospora breviuscula TaxID=2022672 RepID=A0A9Q0HN58_9POAL|nr:hypothetical protein LUZ63_015968 [Rhynchospora breviuscula]